MKIEKLNKWIENHKYVSCAEETFDGNGNLYEMRIYNDKKGKFFGVSFTNNDPNEKFGPNGYIRGEYDEPLEMEKKTRVVEYYEPKKKL